MTGIDFLPLTPLTFYILLVLADRDLHGYGIMQAVEEQTDGAITIGPGTLYSNLKRLLKLGWVEEVESPDTSDDERRKYYRLTDSGHAAARAEAERLRDVVKTARLHGLLDEGGAL